MNSNKCVAPDLDRLLQGFRDGLLNPFRPSTELAVAMDPLFAVLSELAPLKSNDEVKAIWLQIPRGSIEDYDSFEDLVEWGEVETREEYEARWLEGYPEAIKWYELVIVESREKDGSIRFRAISLDHKTIINAAMDQEDGPSLWYPEDVAISICGLLTDTVKEALQKLRDGTYNDEVDRELPYMFRTGVIRRSALWAFTPKSKEYSLDGLSAESITALRECLTSGVNDIQRIGRIKDFTANNFFCACALGYQALKYDCEGKLPSELYLRYADGRDEGLTGKGHGLNEGPGIDFDDPAAWESWYFKSRGGGHPWEIIPGGNSTHMSLYVCHDRQELEWQLHCGEISEDEYKERTADSGYYFRVFGKHRPLEAVTFYLTLSAAGLPVILDDAEEILARAEGTDYVGIVPHHVFPRYCEGMFPERYGHVIDFMHVFDEDMERMGEAIEWIPEEPARLIDPTLASLIQ